MAGAAPQLSRREALTLLAGVRPAAPRAPLAAASLTAGSVAFHYQARFAPRQLNWYTRFSTLVTGAILPAQETAALRRGRSPKLIAYEWASGFYQGDAVSAPLAWQRHCEGQGRRALLTDQPVTGAAAENGRLAHWYDFGSDQHISDRAAFLADRLIRAGYDGYFFDTVGDQCLPPAVLNAFKERYPGVDYNARQGLFLKHLRALLPAGKLIFLNQGYRHADELLPHADLDLSESYVTYLKGEATAFRPWHDPARPWEAVKTPMEKLIAPALNRHPHVRMVHANYAAPGSIADAARACRYSAACAMLYGHRAYTIVPGKPEAEESEFYFKDFGAPAGRLEEDASGLVAWRVFERGIVAVNGGPRPARIASLGIALPEPFQGYSFPAGS